MASGLQAPDHEQEVYEYQWLQRSGEWTAELASGIIVPPWSSAAGDEPLDPRMPPPRGMKWKHGSSWRVEPKQPEACDSHGWSYAETLAELALGRGQATSSAHWTAGLRRRRWLRPYEPGVHTEADTAMPGAGKGSSADMPGESLKERVVSLAGDLRKMEDVVQRLTRLADNLGTDADTAAFRELLSRTSQGVQRKVQGYCAQVLRVQREAAQSGSLPRPAARTLQGVVAGQRRLQEALKAVHRHIKVTLDRLPHTVGSARGAASTSSTQHGRASSGAPQAAQQQGQALAEREEMLPDGSVAVMAAIMAEREREALAIATEAAAIKDIMADLATLVAEDSERIQQVDESVGRTVQRVEKGVGHLTHAAEYQASTPCVIM